MSPAAWRPPATRSALQEFTFPFFQDLGPTLTQESPDPTAYETGTFTYSPDADVTGTLVPIDLVIPADTGAQLDLGV